MPTQQAQKNDVGDVQGELESARNHFNRFIYSVSHDFGTPLRAVVSFSSLLSKEYGDSLDARGRQYLEFIVGGGEKAQAMLQGLLQYSRLSTRARSPDKVDTGVLVISCFAALKGKIAGCGGTIRVNGQLPVVMAEREQLFQLFMALLDNAITYHEPAARILVTVSAEEQEAHWKVMIEDNGIGVPQEQSQSVFEVFRRLHTDSEYPGIGMGLAIARRIVEYHGGSIGMQSAGAGGSVFWFTLPKLDKEN